MINTILVLGGLASERETAIADYIARADTPVPSDKNSDKRMVFNAVLLEGLADGKNRLVADAHTTIVRIAIGCLCCGNNLIMRVNLNRLLHQRPNRLFLSLALNVNNIAHLEQIKLFLTTPDYARILTLSDEIYV